jgi:TolA-binding protein
MKRRSIGAACIVSIAVLLIAAALPSCAYFNTLYNARRIYREAEKTQGQEEVGGRGQRDKYKDVVKKCAQMIQDFPKSRWVDDAVFLMGKALFRQGEYDKAIRQFQEILTNFPESDYAPQALYWLGLSHYMKQNYAQALADTDRFLKEYQGHELRYDAFFLGGDIKRAMEDFEGALDYYGRVAEEAKKREIVDEARLKSAELYRAREEWEKATASYEKVLRKGISWQMRYDISLALGECYTKTGKCREALTLFDELIARATVAKDFPPLLLGRAASYACMDSLARVLAVYDEIVKKYPKSASSAEAFYWKGIIYHERLDSLRLAQEAFGKVAGEYANSEFAAVSLEKGSSMRRLLELQKSAGKGQSSDQAAEKRFMAAEIQLTRLGDIPLALTGYTAVLDSFPLTSIAPKAAYAIAWIHQYKLKENDKAIERYRALVERYPRSYQAKGALFQLGFLGAGELSGRLQAYVDSALADTAAIRNTASAAPAPRDTMPFMRSDTVSTAADTLNRLEKEAPPVPADTVGAAQKGGAE